MDVSTGPLPPLDVHTAFCKPQFSSMEGEHGNNVEYFSSKQQVKCDVWTHLVGFYETDTNFSITVQAAKPDAIAWNRQGENTSTSELNML